MEMHNWIINMDRFCLEAVLKLQRMELLMQEMVRCVILTLATILPGKWFLNSKVQIRRHFKLGQATNKLLPIALSKKTIVIK